MSARDWQPGDVAMVRLDPETEIRVMYNGACWVGRKGAFYDLHASARPLAAIDPEDREQVERLSEMVADEIVRNGLKPRDAMQAALREYANPTPPKCKAALNIKGEHYGCDLDADHDGLAHSSKRAEAIWGERP